MDEGQNIEQSPEDGKSERPEEVNSTISPEEIITPAEFSNQTSEITKSEIKEMEVHHHPHVDSHLHGKKNFKEYFLEFLMIFLAVTMGFIAENIRENITKHEREEQLMVMMTEDMKSDMDRLDTAIINNNIKLNKLDTLRSLIYTAAHNKMPDTAIRKMYYLYRFYGGIVYPFSPTQRTLSQFDKNDAFSLLRIQKVSDAIVEYSDYDTRTLAQLEVFRSYQIDALEVGETIFNLELLEHFRSRDSAIALLQSTQKFELMSLDKQNLMLYGNKLYMARAVLLSYILQLQQQKENAEKLNALIKKEYHLENE
jgi:hypothetical protein